MRYLQRLIRGAVLVTLALGAGRTAAAVPDARGVYTACYLKAVGAVRLIDTADPRQRCLDRIETRVTWSQPGPVGPVGSPGPQGVPGPKGDPGATGATGAAGAPGPQGYGASVSAIDPVTGCYEISIVDQLGLAAPGGGKATVCNGQAGPQGIQGVPGLPGLPGVAGENGVAGPTGPTGPTGPQGPAGTGVVAVDTERREIWLRRDGALVGRFFEVAGLGSTSTVAELPYVDAQGNPKVGKLPVALACTEVVLRRGIVVANALLTGWRAEAIALSSGYRSTATIELWDGRSAILASWQLTSAWPSGLQLAPARPGIAVPVEELKLVCETIARVSSPAPSPWPAGAYSFGLEVPGKVSIVVADASGVGSDSEVVESQDGEDRIVRKRPGRLQTHDLTLTCDGPCSAEIAGWRQLVADGNMAAVRADAVLTMYDASHAAVARWILASAWPSATYVATEDGVEREHVVIVSEGTVQTLP